MAIANKITQNKLGSKLHKIKITSLAGAGSARLKTELLRCLRIEWGGHHKFQFGTSDQMFNLWWGHRTFQVRLSGQMFKLGWGHRTKL